MTYLYPSGGGVRLSQQPAAGVVAAAGLARLASMRPLARHAEALRIYGGANAVSAFELNFGVVRYTLILSGAPSRGFSGEGQLLRALSQTRS